VWRIGGMFQPFQSPYNPNSRSGSGQVADGGIGIGDKLFALGFWVSTACCSVAAVVSSVHSPPPVRFQRWTA